MKYFWCNSFVWIRKKWRKKTTDQFGCFFSGLQNEKKSVQIIVDIFSLLHFNFKWQNAVNNVHKHKKEQLDWTSGEMAVWDDWEWKSEFEQAKVEQTNRYRRWWCANMHTTAWKERKRERESVSFGMIDTITGRPRRRKNDISKLHMFRRGKAEKRGEFLT